MKPQDMNQNKGRNSADQKDQKGQKPGQPNQGRDQKGQYKTGPSHTSEKGWEAEGKNKQQPSWQSKDRNDTKDSRW